MQGWLSFLQEEPGIEFNHVWMIIKRAENVCNLWIGIDIFHGFMSLETKEITKFVERGHLPVDELIRVDKIEQMTDHLRA